MCMESVLNNNNMGSMESNIIMLCDLCRSWLLSIIISMLAMCYG